MKKHLNNNLRNMMPYLGFSIAAGFLTALLTTAFKLGAEEVVHVSAKMYEAVRENPAMLPWLILGAAVIGFVASFILSRSRSCKGGGIPTAIAAVQGIVSFRWLASVFVLPFSALLTFFSGMPLGTEGPCVQMGTGIGDGVVKCLGSAKHRGWRRYVMTGGAAAGFSIAAASPVTAILFSIEELQKRFSPLLLTGVTLSVITAQVTVRLLGYMGIDAGMLFEIENMAPLSSSRLFVPLIVGILCGSISLLFTHLYYRIDKIVHRLIDMISAKVVYMIIFVITVVIGYCIADTMGTGHGLVEKLLQTHTVWYMLVLVFIARMLMMMTANTAGVTGGVFLPTLAFGAIIGALCGEGAIALGILEPEHYTLIVVLGITAFLAASSRIPLTACVFAIEALGGIHNILPMVIATTASYLIVEIFGIEDFIDKVIEAKVRAGQKGKETIVVEKAFTVKPDSLVVGKELHDIIWPHSCYVVSYEQVNKDKNHETVGIQEGDIITVRYKTYTPENTTREFHALVGEQ